MRKGYLPRSPITDDAELKRSKIARRHRRLEGDEEQRLLAAANPRLQRLIVAAIETGCRQGELLALIWRYVSHDRGVIRIRAENTKNSTYKEIPISARLRAVLEMARHDPAGQLFGPHHYPFGRQCHRPASRESEEGVGNGLSEGRHHRSEVSRSPTRGGVVAA